MRKNRYKRMPSGDAPGFYRYWSEVSRYANYYLVNPGQHGKARNHRCSLPRIRCENTRLIHHCWHRNDNPDSLRNCFSFPQTFFEDFSSEYVFLFVLGWFYFGLSMETWQEPLSQYFKTKSTLLTPISPFWGELRPQKWRIPTRTTAAVDQRYLFRTQYIT